MSIVLRLGAALAVAAVLQAVAAAQPVVNPEPRPGQSSERRVPPPHPGLIEKLPRRPAPPDPREALLQAASAGFQLQNVVSVRLEPGVQVEALLVSAKAERLAVAPLGVRNALDGVDLAVQAGDPQTVARDLARLPGVVAVQNNWTGRYEAQASEVDPLLGDQWYLINAGGGGYTADADIDADEAWFTTEGSKDVVIAVIDSGVEWDHPELRERILVNELEFNGNQGVDDDLNGYFDDIVGWDFDKADNDPRSVNSAHGTNVAGVIAAAGWNQQSIKGIAGGGLNSEGCLILPIAIGDPSPKSQFLDDAILYALARGARVITLSCSMIPNEFGMAALAVAKSRGVVVVCAAGNDRSSVIWPASEPGVIAVGSTGGTDEATPGSNPGQALADFGLSAPGEEILTLGVEKWILDDGQEWWPAMSLTGTSIAAPQVAAVAGLLLSLPAADRPASADIGAILRESADPVVGAPGPAKVGAGRLNAARAINLALSR